MPPTPSSPLSLTSDCLRGAQAASGGAQAATPPPGGPAFQADIDATSAPAYRAYRAGGPNLRLKSRLAAYAAAPALRRYDEAFTSVLAELRAPAPVPCPGACAPCPAPAPVPCPGACAGVPSVWFIYNMGLVVKTPSATFSIDLAHRLAPRLAPLLDFALVTHNHDDHWAPAFYRAMDGAGKTVVSNFLDNYGALRGGKMPGGYTPSARELDLLGVHIRATLSDHNPYLKDFTTTFEISVGGWTLYHTGDSCDISKLNPERQPDLWVVHPRCGLDIADGVRKFHPRRVAVCHLCELGHPPDKWRWTVADGLADAARAREAGADAFVPLWGDRLA